MAIFLRGNVWWMEYRTRKMRKVVSTGFRKEERAKALAAFSAFRLGFGARPKRSALEGILAAIYDDAPIAKGIPLSAVWSIYSDWFAGKGKSCASLTWTNMHNLVARFVDWASERKILDISDVSVGVARDYVRTLSGKSNKTQRTYCGYLSSVWEAIGQLHPGVHNPWKAATPVNDGTSVRHEIFTDGMIPKIFAEAERVGSGWHLACRIALYTGMRYGDIASLDWSQVDLVKGVISITPNKTRKSSGISLTIPIARALREDLEKIEKREGFVLPAHAAKYLSGRNPIPMSPSFADILSSVGIEGKEYGFHSWRHTANSRMADAGVPNEIRQMLCGWTNADMARHYDHAKHLAELSDAISRI